MTNQRRRYNRFPINMAVLPLLLSCAGTWLGQPAQMMYLN